METLEPRSIRVLRRARNAKRAALYTARGALMCAPPPPPRAPKRQIWKKKRIDDWDYFSRKTYIHISLAITSPDGLAVLSLPLVLSPSKYHSTISFQLAHVLEFPSPDQIYVRFRKPSLNPSVYAHVEFHPLEAPTCPGDGTWPSIGAYTGHDVEGRFMTAIEAKSAIVAGEAVSRYSQFSLYHTPAPARITERKRERESFIYGRVVSVVQGGHS